jgi:predicted transcriptional regulator
MASRTTYQLLGPTERDILEILWHCGPHTIPQIVQAIQHTRPTAYTTIKTITEALLKKGFLTRQRNRGWAHTYTAVAKAELLRTAFERQLDELGATAADRAHVVEALRHG